MVERDKVQKTLLGWLCLGAVLAPAAVCISDVLTTGGLVDAKPYTLQTNNGTQNGLMASHESTILIPEQRMGIYNLDHTGFNFSVMSAFLDGHIELAFTDEDGKTHELKMSLGLTTDNQQTNYFLVGLD